MIVPPPAVARSHATTILTAVLEARTGQQLSPGREWRLETALKPLLRDLGFATIDDLAHAAQRQPDIGGQVVDALLNQESSFFRDLGAFDLVADAVATMREENPARRMRVWSAGCSFGQEPLSLAMLFAERMLAADAILPEILATDVSEAALARARAARFSQFEIQRGLPVQQMIRWFDAQDEAWVAKPELVRRIQFRRLNLVADPLPTGRFDAILCRNVLLYLSPKLRCRVLDRLATVIRPGGVLVLGAGETVIGQTEAFRPSTRYRGLYEPA